MFTLCVYRVFCKIEIRHITNVKGQLMAVLFV